MQATQMALPEDVAYRTVDVRTFLVEINHTMSSGS